MIYIPLVSCLLIPSSSSDSLTVTAALMVELKANTKEDMFKMMDYTSTAPTGNINVIDKSVIEALRGRTLICIHFFLKKARLANLFCLKHKSWELSKHFKFKAKSHMLVFTVIFKIKYLRINLFKTTYKPESILKHYKIHVVRWEIQRK